MFKEIVIKLKPLLVNLLKKVEQVEQNLSFKKRVKLKKTTILNLSDKIFGYIFILVFILSSSIKFLTDESSYFKLSILGIFLQVLSLIFLSYLIFRIVLKLKPITEKVFTTTSEENRKSILIFWTLSLLNLALTILFIVNNFSLYIFPVTGIALLISMLLNFWYGIVFSLVSTFIIGFFYISKEINIYSYLLYYLISSLYALTLFRKIYSRNDLFKSIVSSVLFNFILVFFIEIILGHNDNIFKLSFYHKLFFVGNKSIFVILLETLFSGVFSWIIVSVLLSPLETVYQKATPIKLVELSDFNNILIKKLMTEAPGTYHHSIMVSTLAENVAVKVGASHLLCKVASFYHDIGKLIKPEYFIENQSVIKSSVGEFNPSLSVLVILNHVKEGVKLGYEHKLDKEIIDIIEQHHGNSVIYGLYDKNLEFDFNKDVIRYPGPKPQTKEAAIIMICDSCEAACRSIGEPDAQKIKQTVESVINTKFIDGQFDETPFTLRDLYVISNIVTQMLISLYHLRTRQRES
ncbi:MAG: HDIG domain-containing protein [Endomicrobia bacterium]|nr:HDIG domain-containing protein [Endomicrobiia bacterium]